MRPPLPVFENGTIRQARPPQGLCPTVTAPSPLVVSQVFLTCTVIASRLNAVLASSSASPLQEVMFLTCLVCAMINHVRVPASQDMLLKGDATSQGLSCKESVEGVENFHLHSFKRYPPDHFEVCSTSALINSLVQPSLSDVAPVRHAWS